MNSGQQSRKLIVNYQTLGGNNSLQYVKSGVRTDFYKKQRGTCTGNTPFACQDGSCAQSVGACVLRTTYGSAVPPQWKSTQYEESTISAVGYFSSSRPQYASNIDDGNQDTFWQSGRCYPTSYIVLSEANLLAGLCAAGRCIISTTTGNDSSSSSTSLVTDMNTDTTVYMTSKGQKTFFQVSLATPSKLAAVTAKISCTAQVSVYGIVAATKARQLIGVIFSNQTYQLKNFDVWKSSTLSTTVFSSLRLETTVNTVLAVFEIAARNIPCFEYAGIDYGKVVTVSALTIQHWAGSSTSVTNTFYEYSLDKVTWNKIDTKIAIPPNLLHALDVEVYPAVAAQYLRVRHVFADGVADNVYVWELSAWGANGKFGKLGPVQPNPINFRDLLGVNGIWGWGGQGGNTAHDGWGAKRYTPVAGHARNYHSWNWDVSDPDRIPNYDGMSCGSGTEVQSWLSWDMEYGGWNAANLEVEVSLNFLSLDFPPSIFNDPYRAAYNYGYSFATHFGSQKGVDLVSTLEVGNEPGYAGYSDPVFYGTLLLGMARGAKDADPTMRVTPGHFETLNETLSRLNATTLKLLDALNIHAYSWTQTELGRTGVYPEHNMSTLNAVNSMLRFRDQNLPGMPIFLSEWGWDSEGGGEDCYPPTGISGSFDPICVSESAQAVYAVRGALLLARKGFSRLTWFFYGNGDATETSWKQTRALFSRSGLVTSSSGGYKNKASFYALKDFLSSLGEAYFKDVIQENREAYVYILGNKSHGNSHIVAWRPVDAETNTAINISFSFNFAPSLAWFLGYSSLKTASLPLVSSGQWSMSITAYPTVVELKSSETSSVKCSKPCLNGGICIDGNCVCSFGYRGLDCSAKTCENSCWQRGSCTSSGTCVCDKYSISNGGGEFGRCHPEDLARAGVCRDTPSLFDSASNCLLHKCKNDCSGHGSCTPNGCNCNVGWGGSSCQNSTCPFNCRSHGVCNKNTCTCRQGFVGPTCQWPDQYAAAQIKSPCPKGKPVLCNDGSCSVSLGNCVLQQKYGSSTPKKWISNDYDTQTLPAAGFISSSSSNYVYKINDGDENTFWQSQMCYPTGYLYISEVNLLGGLCAAGRCMISTSTGNDSKSSSTSPITDGNTNTAIYMTSKGQKTFFQVSLSTPSKLAAVTAKISCTAQVSVYGIVAATKARQLIGVIFSNQTYQLKNFDVWKSSTLSTTVFSSLRLETTVNTVLAVFEIAARNIPCFEYAGIDYGKVVTVSALTIQHWAGSSTSVTNTFYEYSLDGTRWLKINTSSIIPSQLLSSLDVEIFPAVSVRYIRVRHVLAEAVYGKVYVWELSAWDEYGKFGKVPAVHNPIDFRNLLGVDGIFGWGTGSYSSKLNDFTGPAVFSPLCSHGRNYHNWNWDVSDPTIIPPFDQMVQLGSNDFGALPGAGSKLNSNWLNWDNEYTAWKLAGLEVEASIQFMVTQFPQNTFKNPFLNAYNYGYQFAKHFGSLNGTGNVATMEVGNEPWIAGMGYSDAVFYNDILLGMAKGAKDADPTMRVLPGSFGSLNDTLLRLNSTHVQYLDALNIHAYSWYQTAQGRSGIHPEHNMSTFHSVNSLLRFRDLALPGLPAYITEWGWDSAGGGEDCSPPPGYSASLVCLTEEAQALYAVRGALILARKGFARMTWFFYGNTAIDVPSWPAVKGLFSRSGLRSTAAAGYKLKQSYYALKNFISILGSTNFHGLIQEDRDAYVYILLNPSTNATFIVAWRPLDAQIRQYSSVSFPCSFVPVYASILGNFSVSNTTLPIVTGSGSTMRWTMQISVYPIVVSVQYQAKTPLTASPSSSPTAQPSLSAPSLASKIPTNSPFFAPTGTASPSIVPSTPSSFSPSSRPSIKFPTFPSSSSPSILPSRRPSTNSPSKVPSLLPTVRQTINPSTKPTLLPSSTRTTGPSAILTRRPSVLPTALPTRKPSSAKPSTLKPSTKLPIKLPTVLPSNDPSSRRPTMKPSAKPTPTLKPTAVPIVSQSVRPSPSPFPSRRPSKIPSKKLHATARFTYYNF